MKEVTPLLAVLNASRRNTFWAVFWLGAMMIAALSGCSTVKTKYNLNAGASYSIREERYSQGLASFLSAATGKTVTTTSGDNSKIRMSGIGGLVGLVEDSSFLSAEINFFYTKYLPTTYVFNITGEGDLTQTLSGGEIGGEAKVGIQLGPIRPHLSYHYGRTNLDVATSGGAAGSFAITSSAATEFLIGGGTSARFPLGKKLNVSVHADYRVPLRQPAGVKVAHARVAATLEVFLFEVGRR